MASKSPSRTDIKKTFKSMKEHYDNEPKVKVRLQKDLTNENNKTRFVTLNGYDMTIERGVWTEVPESIAMVLEQAGEI